MVPLLEFLIIILTAQWLLGFSGMSLIPGIAHTGGSLYVLSVLIVVLIMMKFLSWP